MIHISDHSAAFLQLNVRRAHHKSGSIFFNLPLLKQADLKAAMLRAWEESTEALSQDSKSVQVTAGLKAIMSENIRLSRLGKKAGRTLYQSQFKEVREAESSIAQDWNNLQAWESLNRAQEKLEEVRMEKIERKKNQSGALWARMGDKCTREFFDFHKASRAKTIIKELQIDSKIIREQAEISGAILNFYKRLYEFDPLTEINIRACSACLRSVPTVVTQVQNKELLLPFTEQDFREALKELEGAPFRKGGRERRHPDRSSKTSLAGDRSGDSQLNGGNYTG